MLLQSPTYASIGTAVPVVWVVEVHGKAVLAPRATPSQPLPRQLMLTSISVSYVVRVEKVPSEGPIMTSRVAPFCVTVVSSTAGHWKKSPVRLQ